MTFDALIEHQAYLANNSSRTYSTRDEITFIADLKRRRQTAVLRTLRALVDQRTWEGGGMHVEVAAVRQALDAALESLA